MNVEEIRSEAQARRFLPEGGGRYGLVLFIRSDDAACLTAVAVAAAQADSRTMHVIDVDRFPATPAWFGLAGVPAMAVVADGALLAIEHRCSPDTLRRLDDMAGPLLRCISEW